MSSSQIRYRMPWKIQKRSSEPDRWLDEMGFFRKHIARDASCLFRAVSENINNTQRYFHKVRSDTIHFMTSKRHLFEGSLTCPFENYIKEMSNPTEWGGMIEISAMSHLYRRDFVIFEANKGSQTKMCNGYGRIIYLFYSPESKHFDAVYTKDFINASSYCQSLVYEILYDGVYQIKDLPYAVDKMLHDKVANNHFEYYMSENFERRKKQKERAKIFVEAPIDDNKDKNNNTLALKCKHYTEDIEKSSLLKESLSIFVLNRSLIQLENVCVHCLNINSAKELLDNGITPFPYKVAKALDPDIYRNIEFDVWSEVRRELRYGARYSDGTTLQVGVKCLCRLQPDQPVAYRCHIQEMRPEEGPCLVFIEDIGEMREVNFEQLEPLPVDEIKPWAPPYRYSQAKFLGQMLPQLGNIPRKQSTKARKLKSEDHAEEKVAQKVEWKQDAQELYTNTYYHVDMLNFEPMPVEVKALPLMVDNRSPGASPHDMAQPPNGGPPNGGLPNGGPPNGGLPNGGPPNGGPLNGGPPNGGPPENHYNQGAASGDVGAHVIQNSGRSSTPASAVPAHQYPGNMSGGCGYTCGKSVMWCPPGLAPPAPYVPAPPPPGVNAHAQRSMHPAGLDLPMNDLATLRYFYNVGVESVWAAYGPPPPRQYSRDLAHDMQQMSISGHEHHRHKNDKQGPSKNTQRPLLGPRFKRGNHQDGAQNNHQNKGHASTPHNRGPNNRYTRAPEGRSYEEVVLEPPLMSIPYITYPPPVYPIPYYPIDADPAMMGMMGGMGYVGYDDGVEYAMPPLYPPTYAPPAPPALHHAPPALAAPAHAAPAHAVLAHAAPAHAVLAHAPPAHAQPHAAPQHPPNGHAPAQQYEHK